MILKNKPKNNYTYLITITIMILLAVMLALAAFLNIIVVRVVDKSDNASLIPDIKVIPQNGKTPAYLISDDKTSKTDNKYNVSDIEKLKAISPDNDIKNLTDQYGIILDIVEQDDNTIVLTGDVKNGKIGTITLFSGNKKCEFEASSTFHTSCYAYNSFYIVCEKEIAKVDLKTMEYKLYKKENPPPNMSPVSCMAVSEDEIMTLYNSYQSGLARVDNLTDGTSFAKGIAGIIIGAKQTDDNSFDIYNADKIEHDVFSSINVKSLTIKDNNSSFSKLEEKGVIELPDDIKLSKYVLDFLADENGFSFASISDESDCDVMAIHVDSKSFKVDATKTIRLGVKRLSQLWFVE